MNFPDIHVWSRTDSDTSPFFESTSFLSLIKQERVVVFGVPAAFLQNDRQITEYEGAYDQLINLGVDEVYCVCSNDVDVIEAWKDHLSIENIQLIADGNNDLANRLGIVYNAESIGFGNRLKRFASVVNNGNTEYFIVEGEADDEYDPYNKTTVANIINYLQSNPRT